MSLRSPATVGAALRPHPPHWPAVPKSDTASVLDAPSLGSPLLASRLPSLPCLIRTLVLATCSSLCAVMDDFLGPPCQDIEATDDQDAAAASGARWFQKGVNWPEPAAASPQAIYRCVGVSRSFF